MKTLFYSILLLSCVACGEDVPRPKHLTRYEVTCPVNTTLATVDTVDAFTYYYGSNSLKMYTPPAANERKLEYPTTCVVSFIQDWQEGK